MISAPMSANWPPANPSRRVKTRPPTRLRASRTTTSWPAPWISVAATKPDSPAPTTISFMLTCCVRRRGARCPRRSVERLPNRREHTIERRQVEVFEGGRGKRHVECRDPRHGRVQVVEDLLHQGRGNLRAEAGGQRRFMYDHASARLGHLDAEGFDVQRDQRAQIEHGRRNAILRELVRGSVAQLHG